MRAGLLSNFSLGVNALRRDWRSGELRLLLLALLIAVAAVSSVGFLSDRVGRALERDAGQMLGGDLALQADEPIPAQFLAQASRQGLATPQTMQFPSLVSGGRANQLFSLQSVFDGYPLPGDLPLSYAFSVRAFSPRPFSHQCQV